MSTIALTVPINSVTIDTGSATLTASVTNSAPLPTRIVLGIVDPPAADPATSATSWTTIEKPVREIDAGATEQYTVALTPPADTAAGTYALRLIAYDADQPPDENSDQATQIQVLIPAKPAPAATHRRVPWWIYAVAGVLVIAIAVVAVILIHPRNKPSLPIGTSAAGGSSTVTSSVASSSIVTSGSSPVTSSAASSSSTVTSSAAVTDPHGPDFVLFAIPECAVVPRGALSGADELNIFVALRNDGPGGWHALVPFRLDSDTGLHSQGNTAVSTGSAFTAMQVDLGPSDYNKTHTFTIEADPDNTIVERDESNNSLQVTVSLPAQAASGGDVSCTSP